MAVSLRLLPAMGDIAIQRLFKSVPRSVALAHILVPMLEKCWKEAKVDRRTRQSQPASTVAREGNEGMNGTYWSIPKTINASLGNERVKMQLRGDFFNIFNHPTFGMPNSALQTGVFGFSTNTATPERIGAGPSTTQSSIGRRPLWTGNTPSVWS